MVTDLKLAHGLKCASSYCIKPVSRVQYPELKIILNEF